MDRTEAILAAIALIELTPETSRTAASIGLPAPTAVVDDLRALAAELYQGRAWKVGGAA